MRRLRLSDTETYQVVRIQTLLSERSTCLVGEGIGDWRPVAEGGSLVHLVTTCLGCPALSAPRSFSFI